jgi:hypothetical protein
MCCCLNEYVFFSKDDKACDNQAYVDKYENKHVTGEAGKVPCSEILRDVIVEPCRSVTKRIANCSANSTVGATHEKHKEHRNNGSSKGLFCAEENC